LYKILVILFCLILVQTARAQSIKLSGNILDSTGKQALPNALMMAVTFRDSTLINFSRTDAEGVFKPIRVPLDTYLVVISHPSFSDKTYLLAPSPKDSTYNFKNVVLPPKTTMLQEVEIIASREKSYYKGDTLVFTADSFKTAANATVEDLLKKLPGVKVDASGKITIQGKQVDQVLVDGDEFFGSDPTMATRNLNANIVDNVQVYEKKNENSENSDETLKILNLKLKEDSKKGYFGKTSVASDAQQFYESDLLFNRFKGAQKLSVFGLLSNTPKNGFDWSDNNKYGLDNENKYNYDPETNSWTSNGDDKAGIPQTAKTGFYFNDKLGKKTKINADYSYRNTSLKAGIQTNTQFFFSDTSYYNKQNVDNKNNNSSHRFNLNLVSKLDSLTELSVRPRLNAQLNENQNLQYDAFLTAENILTRETNINNNNNNSNYDGNMNIRLSRNFKKKDRNLVLFYTPSFAQSKGNTSLNTNYHFEYNAALDSALLQQKTQNGDRFDQITGVTYTEPLNKKVKLEFRYTYNRNRNNNLLNTYDYDGVGYNDFNTRQSNNFRNTTQIHSAGAKLIYDVKKYRISFGSIYRNILQENLNLTKDTTLSTQVGSFLPNAAFVYRISQGSNLNINYSSSFKQPAVQQLQPLIDNSDPNRLKVGNPDLKPQFTNNLNLNYYFYKGISDINFYSGVYANQVNNEINETSYFDSIGRSITAPLNINGNYYCSIYLGGGFPVFKKFMRIEYNLNSGLNNNVSYINQQKNITQHFLFSPGLNLAKRKEKYDIDLGGNYEYNNTKQSLNAASVKPYYTYQLYGSLRIKFPKGFNLLSDARYTNNGNRSPGFNLNYVIWNASFSKTFLKTENLITSIELNDILNQNISNERRIESNMIVDTKTQIIKRYFLLRLLYKFNSQKAQASED
jgi:hypothetical protein